MPFFFDQLDTNHDGFIDYEEVLGIYKIFGCSDEKSRVSITTQLCLMVNYPTKLLSWYRRILIPLY